MKKGLLLLGLFSWLTSFGHKDTGDSDKTEFIQEQKQIVSKLSGNSEIKDGYILKSRKTEEEREIVRSYLKNIITKISLQPEEHAYSASNSRYFWWYKSLKGKNIYATLPSTNYSNEYVIIGVHYDTVEDCPGANDNASGIAMAYEVVKKLKDTKFRNKNIMLVFFDQEEIGFIGSKAFAEYLKDKNFKVHSVHTLDQMGWDKDGDRAIELELPTKYLYGKYSEQAKKLNITVHTTKVNYADHRSFRNAGFNAVGITEEYYNKDTTPYWHSPQDTYNTINFEYLASSTNLMFKVIENIISGSN